jgi:hypothetical protein
LVLLECVLSGARGLESQIEQIGHAHMREWRKGD